MVCGPSKWASGGGSGAHLEGMTLSVRSPYGLVAIIPHMLGFKLLWTTSDCVGDASQALDTAVTVRGDSRGAACCGQVGPEKPISALRNTDLPVPEGPSMTETSPAGMVRATSPQISCFPKGF